MNRLNSTPIEILRKRLKYDAETGKLFWQASELNASCWNATFDGKEALTSKDKDGYLVGTMGRKRFLAHRVAWELYHGEWPDEFMDHINHDRTDNRIVNLRQVDRQGNQRNLSRRSDNTSGVNGVGWHKPRKKWRAHIYVNKKSVHLGLYDRFEDAVAARKVAEQKHGYHENHGLCR